MRQKFLKQLSKKVNLIGVTGTHGKTSTTALLAHIFMFNGINISYIYGGVTSFNGIGGHYGDESLPLLLETDEAFNSYVYAVALEPDNANFHRNLSTLKKYKEGDTQLIQMQTLLSSTSISKSERINLCFALAKAYEDLEVLMIFTSSYLRSHSTFRMPPSLLTLT